MHHPTDGAEELLATMGEEVSTEWHEGVRREIFQCRGRVEKGWNRRREVPKKGKTCGVFLHQILSPMTDLEDRHRASLVCTREIVGRLEAGVLLRVKGCMFPPEMINSFLVSCAGYNHRHFETMLLFWIGLGPLYEMDD